MKCIYFGLLAVILCGMVAAQVPTEEAVQRMQARQARRLEASTQPALTVSAEELDKIWDELNLLHSEVRKLQADIKDMHDQAATLARARALLDPVTGKPRPGVKAQPVAGNAAPVGDTSN